MDSRGVRPRRVAIVVAVTLLIGLVSGFGIGRITRSSSSPESLSGSPPRTGIDLTGAVGLETKSDLGWISQALINGEGVGGHPDRPFNIYDSQTGNNVVAWLYDQCGMPEAIVPPHHKQPNCGPGGTSSPHAR